MILSLSFAVRTAASGDKDDCRILTEIPVNDYKNCPAVATPLSCLMGVIVPVVLQVMGITSVRSETDEWLLESCCTYKRAVRSQACVGESSHRADALIAFPF